MRSHESPFHKYTGPDHWFFNPLYLGLMLVIIQLTIALLTDSLVFTQEESMWQYIGRNWVRHGLVPYSGGIDNKSPFIFLIFGLSDSLFGVNYLLPRLLGIVVQGVGMIYIFKITSYISGRYTGILALIIYGLSLAWKSTGGKYVSFTEIYAVTGIIIAYYHVLIGNRTSHFLIAGILAGLGFGFRITAVFGILAMLHPLILKGRKEMGTFLISLSATIAQVVLVFSMLGINLTELTQYGFFDNFSSGGVTDRSLSWKLENFANSFFYSEIILFYPFILTYLIFPKRSSPLVSWLGLEFAGIVLVGIFARNHLKHLLPVMSIISAVSLSWLVNEYGLPSKKVLLIICLVFFPKTWEPFFALKKIFAGSFQPVQQGCESPYNEPPPFLNKQLGIWLRDHLSEDEYVYVAGTGSTIQAYSERRSPSVYFNATHTEAARKQLMLDLNNNDPKFILVPKFESYNRHVPHAIREFIAAKVAVDYSFHRCLYGYDIYLRRLRNGK